MTRDLRIPTRDGVELLADYLEPVGPSRGTILLRSPYGSNAIMVALFAAPYARQGYRVVLARCRGTFGSGGPMLDPMVREVDDAADTMTWLRKQPWFDGRFATAGPSYLGFTQWALLMDPPPELTCAVIQVGPHDFSRAAYEGGAFNLNAFLAWSDTVAHQESGFLETQYRLLTERRRWESAMPHLPLAEAGDRLCGNRAPWFRDWVSNRDLASEQWTAMNLDKSLDHVQVPVLLQTGWQDLFLNQTLDQYERLNKRGVEVALTVGPWDHYEFAGKGSSTLMNETLDWLSAHLTGETPRPRTQPVRAMVTGADEWVDLDVWPPATTPFALHLHPGGVLGDEPAPVGSTASFTYDPAFPTPTIGGRLLKNGGYRDDTELGERSDVVTFTGAPLPADMKVFGSPVAELHHLSDNPFADLFVRISEVDSKGRSRNVSDGFVRLDPDRIEKVVRIEMDPIAHRFSAGNRVRITITGGSFPRWERNLGTREDPATSTRMKPSHRTIVLSGSHIALPS
ncbi:CocE/NonD family hydrolase [Nocardia asteroides]|uniref:CocE/NonD family hydrolase n=1 Tax=Nocardia asteroides TaxID=1824 RepID=UPI001E658D3C|nr:CocE/NonD family hydrolase [Nocardia asteroides]UGT62688.1 CocE/NonD family hydrolase [Nocardia asteroides]